MAPIRNGQVGKALNRYESSLLTHCSDGENEAMDQGSKILGGKAVVTLTSKTIEVLIFPPHYPSLLPFKAFSHDKQNSSGFLLSECISLGNAITVSCD